MSNVVVQTIVSETVNAAAAAKTGWHRAAIHSRIGNSTAIGSTISHGGGSETTIIVVTANVTSAAMLSTISLRGGGSRSASARPITSGATVMTPKASDANQCCQMAQAGAVGLWNNLYAIRLRHVLGLLAATVVGTAVSGIGGTAEAETR